MTTAPPVPPRPPQAWAHRQGRIDMRPLRPADWSVAAITARARITEAFHRFATAHDEARIDVLISCFTQDTVFEVALGGAEPFTRLTGRAELSERLTRIITEQGDQRRHVMGNILVEELDLTTGTASALAYGVVTVAAHGLGLGASVIYTGELRREHDDCWRFTSFFIGMDAYTGERPASREK